MLFLNILWVVAAALLLVLTVALATTALRLRNMRWQATGCDVVSRDEAPLDMRALLDLAQADLQKLGYTYLTSLRTDSVVAVQTARPLFHDLYRHANGQSYGLVSQSPLPSFQTPFAVQWLSHLEGGMHWATLNGMLHFTPFTTPGWQYFDDYLPDWREAATRHEARLAESGRIAHTDAEAFVHELGESFTGLVGQAVESGQLVRNPAGQLRLPWKRVLWFTFSILKGQWRTWRSKAPTPVPAIAHAEGDYEEQAPDNTALQADLLAYHQHIGAKQASTTPPAKRALWAVGTAVLFLVVGMLWLSWSAVVALLVVVAIHEGGHYLAMRLTGYRNLSIYFLPGLGGMASGEKVDASPFEKLLVYLAGPVPGIVAALAVHAAYTYSGSPLPDWAREWFWFSLFINYLNLLPLTPLDGGRVLDTFVFARLPRWRFAFALVCWGVLLALAIASNDTVLQVVCAVMAFGMPYQWRAMQIRRALYRPGEQALDQESALALVFGALQRESFRHWSFAKRMATANALLPELRTRKASVRQSLAGLGIYVVCFFAPLAVLLVTWPELRAAAGVFSATSRIPPDDVTPLAQEQPPAPLKNWRAELARAAELSPQAHLEALLGAGQEALDEDDMETAQTHFAAAWERARNLPERDLTRVAVLQGMADVSESAEEQTAHLNRIVQSLSSPQGAEVAFVARALEQLSYTDIPPAQQITLLKRAVALREQDTHSDAPVHALATARLMLAKALDTHGQPGDAEALMRTRTEHLPMPAANDKSRAALNLRVLQAQTQVDHAWLLIAHQRPDEAFRMTRQAYAAMPKPATASWLYVERQTLEALVWSSLLARQPQELRVYWPLYEDLHTQGPYAQGGKLLFLEIDRALVAQAMNNRHLLEKTRKDIAESLSKNSASASHWCRTFSQGGYNNWRLPQIETRRRLLQEQGACAPAGN